MKSKKEEKFVSDGSEFVFTQKKARQVEERFAQVEQGVEESKEKK